MSLCVCVCILVGKIDEKYFNLHLHSRRSHKGMLNSLTPNHTHTHSLSLLLPMNASSIILHMRYFNWSFSQVFVLFVLDFLLLSHQFLICNYWKLVLNSFQISSVFHLSGFHHLFICLNIIQRRTNPCVCVCVFDVVVVGRCRLSGIEMLAILSIKHVCQRRRVFDKDQCVRV